MFASVHSFNALKWLVVSSRWTVGRTVNPAAGSRTSCPAEAYSDVEGIGGGIERY